VKLVDPVCQELFAFTCTYSSDFMIVASIDGVLKFFDIRTKFMIELALVAYRGRILGMQISPCD
jgi:hypothetical protein